MTSVTSIDRKHAEDKFVVRMPQGLRDQLKQKPRITTARPTARSSIGWSAATSSRKNSRERTEWSTNSSPRTSACRLSWLRRTRLRWRRHDNGQDQPARSERPATCPWFHCAAGSGAVVGPDQRHAHGADTRPGPPLARQPRTTRNPKYDELKESIRHRGLDTPPPVTRRPGKTNTAFATAATLAWKFSTSSTKRPATSVTSVSTACSGPGTSSAAKSSR